MTASNRVERLYAEAREQYAELGVDVDAALATLKTIPISLHCWQGDDVTGFENLNTGLTGGIAATGKASRTGRGPAGFTAPGQGVSMTVDSQGFQGADVSIERGLAAATGLLDTVAADRPLAGIGPAPIAPARTRRDSPPGGTRRRRSTPRIRGTRPVSAARTVAPGRRGRTRGM